MLRREKVTAVLLDQEFLPLLAETESAGPGVPADAPTFGGLPGRKLPAPPVPGRSGRLVLLTSGTTGTSGSSGTSGTSGSGPSGTSGGVPTGPNDRATNSYYLVESNGAVAGYAGAPMFGSKASRKLPAPVVASAAVPGGHGYWLLTAAGNLYVFGSAVHFGKPWMAPHSGSFVGLATTPDGAGLWRSPRAARSSATGTPRTAAPRQRER